MFFIIKPLPPEIILPDSSLYIRDRPLSGYHASIGLSQIFYCSHRNDIHRSAFILSSFSLPRLNGGVMTASKALAASVSCKITEERFSAVAVFNYFRFYRYPSQKRHPHFQRHLFSTACFKNICSNSAMRTDKTAHILHNTDNRQINMTAKRYRFPDIVECNVLGCCDNNSAVRPLKELCDRYKFVAGAGWTVHDKIIKVSPPDIGKKLPYQTMLRGALHMTASFRSRMRKPMDMTLRLLLYSTGIKPSSDCFSDTLQAPPSSVCSARVYQCP